MRTVLNGHKKPVVLTRENCTINGYRWPPLPAYWAWDDMDWSSASFQPESIWTALYGADDPHLRVPHKDGETAHRVRGKRWKITGLLDLAPKTGECDA